MGYMKRLAEERMFKGRDPDPLTRLGMLFARGPLKPAFRQKPKAKDKGKKK